MKRVFAFLLLFPLFSAVAQNGLKFKAISDTEAELYDGKEAVGDVVIPDKVMIGGVEFIVTQIGFEAFMGPEKRKERIISSNLKITSVKFPSTLKVIQARAFLLCENLKEITIPNSLSYIDFSAFSSCGIEKLTIPEGVKFIGVDAFSCNNNLKSVYLPNSLDSISEGAFKYCKNLTTAILPDHPIKVHEIVESEFNGIFRGCSKLTDVRGHVVILPEWEEKHFENTPFKKKIPSIKSSFSNFASIKIYQQMTNWQKKGKFETTAQWRERMSDENRKIKMTEIIKEAKKEYIEKGDKNQTAILGTYNADKSEFPVTIGENKLILKIPVAEAKAFKDVFSNTPVTPNFDVVDDHLAMISATFNVDGKQYTAINEQHSSAEDLAFDLPIINLDQYGSDGKTMTQKTPSNNITPSMTDNSLDTNIPQLDIRNDHTFAVIIGNEEYQRVTAVPYAQNDARVFAEYCKKTLGLPEKNVKFYQNATFGTMVTAISDLQDIAKAFYGDINIIFYYAGHGIPNEANGEAFLLPVDADGSQTEVCYPTTKLYKELADMNAKLTTVFLDACFSGAQRGNGMLVAARGVAIKAKASKPRGNLVVFSAATGDQTAYPYNDKQHGLFSYWLMRKIRDDIGDMTLGELTDYVTEKVLQTSILENQKSQTPLVTVSESISNNWKQMKLK